VSALATAPGKLVVLGEYAVLEGGRALVAAVDRRAAVRAEPAPGPATVVRAPELGIDRAECVLARDAVRWVHGTDREIRGRLALVVGCLQGAPELLSGDSLPALEISIDTSAFVAADGAAKLGIGSSAAVAVATIAAAVAAAGGDVRTGSGRQRVLEAALEAHAGAQGGGSGVDVAAALAGGVTRYRRRTARGGPEVDALSVPRRLRVIAVWSGRPASTPALVAGVQRFAAARPGRYAGMIQRMADLAEVGTAAFAAADVDVFLGLVDAYCAAMDELGRAGGVDIVSAPHRAIATVVRAAGGAYKPSGAGGGDLGLAFAADDEVQERIARGLREDGWTAVPVAIAERGLDVRDSHQPAG
jgi:phosphomevalonate kinase